MAFKSQLDKFKDVRNLLQEEKKKTAGEFDSNDTLFFKPQMPKKEGDQELFTVRFLPLEEVASGKPWIQFNYHMFKRPGDNKYIKVLDPRFFDKQAQNPIADLAKQLFDTGNELDKKRASSLYRKPRYFTLVYVKDAPETQKDLIGKVLIFEAGVKLYNKLESAMNLQKMCFYDPFKGNDFLLVVEKGGSNDEAWANYDKSVFLGEQGPIVEDAKELDKIAAVAEKIKIKDVVLKKDPLKGGAELLQLLQGGVNKIQKETTSTVTELVENKQVTVDSKKDINFGDVPVEKETKGSILKKDTKVVEKEPTKVGGEVSVDEQDWNVTFDESDFKH